jgi:hypothetical protein
MQMTWGRGGEEAHKERKPLVSPDNTNRPGFLKNSSLLLTWRRAWSVREEGKPVPAAIHEDVSGDEVRVHLMALVRKACIIRTHALNKHDGSQMLPRRHAN